MADQGGRQAPTLKDNLLGQPRRYSFFQAVRLLRTLAGKPLARDGEEFFRNDVRIRPYLSLGFPASDVSSIEQRSWYDDRDEEQVRYRITATFLGLYGAASPLPTYYTEELLAEASEDESITRDFIDIINNSFYRLLYECWSKYRWWHKIFEEQAPEYLNRLYCLLGLGEECFQERIPFAFRLLRHVGLLTQYPRSAAGLRTLVSDVLDVDEVDLEPFVPRLVDIPGEQLWMLGSQGSTLGEDVYLGRQIEDRSSRFRLIVGPVDEKKFRLLLPDSPSSFILGTLLGLYLDQPLECELSLVLDRNEAGTARLGDERWSTLGQDTWIFSSDTPPENPVFTYQVEQA